MPSFTVFVDEMTDSMQPSASPSYTIALAPSDRSVSAMATRWYSTKESLAADLQQHLGYTNAAERFFASDDRHQALSNHPLSDEDAVYLGWLPDFDRN